MEFENLKYISKLIYKTYKIPSIFFNYDTEGVIVEFPTSFPVNPLYKKEDLIKKLVQGCHTGPPIIKITDHSECYIIVKINTGDLPVGFMILGPTISPTISNDMILESFVHLQINKELLHQISLYYKKLQRIPERINFECAQDLYFLLYREILNITDINYNLNLVQTEVEDPTLSLFDKRESANFHHSIKYEQRLFQYIKEGNKNEIIQNFRAFPQEKAGSLSKNSYLRSRKNIGIVVITVAVRAAIEGGLHYELAYTLSDSYIQNLEELTNVQHINTFLENILVDLAERVHLSKLQNYSKPINECISYIYLHLYEEVHLKHLAELINLHPNYLSRLFNKEVGMSLREYIQRLKINEAKNLLVYSDYSLSKIASILNFHDQSHFSRVFKKVAGITPKQYISQG
ncbi:helix-turn-helix domain-containing protein [Alkalihalobacillus sp. MEB130]|uniref:helix-turn-helix domain-containing protein n=1 Tax=Alkalihalobacillus sp. MEB130 TaxID=2976704 RepID=UPI0028E0678F|nr:helix-turn-helix domain-containing protein [Alkalihalobacillus sp. MEB130]MDT8861817.1 helix-turn-helix domain-containing protein [Alkalihalobacillus sp. MEB130]